MKTELVRIATLLDFELLTGSLYFAEYVKLYIDWILNTSVKQQFEAIYEGFHHVCSRLIIKMLRSEDLEEILCGISHLDFTELENHTKYMEYSSNDTMIKFVLQHIKWKEGKAKNTPLQVVLGSCKRYEFGR